MTLQNFGKYDGMQVVTGDSRCVKAEFRHRPPAISGLDRIYLCNTEGLHFRMDFMVLWWNYVVTILEYGTLVVIILCEIFAGIFSVTILL